MASYDLHSHTVFSPDARKTPEELVALAAARGCRLLSITDHNHLGSQPRACAAAERLGLPYLTGVELDLHDPESGRFYHFLVYGFNPQDAGLTALADRQRGAYAQWFGEIVEGFALAGEPLDVAPVEAGLATRYAGNPAPALNQWWAEEYLVRSGKLAGRQAFASLLKRARALRPLTPAGAFFAGVEEAFRTVHAAGGVVLLAHVGRYFPGAVEPQIALIRSLLARGMDGFELYHPSNLAEPGFEELEAAAQALDCLLSAGSDTHHTLWSDEPDQPRFGRMTVPEWVRERLPRSGAGGAPSTN